MQFSVADVQLCVIEDVGRLVRNGRDTNAQRREIAQMKYLIADIEENGVRVAERLPEEVEQ